MLTGVQQDFAVYPRSGHVSLRGGGMGGCLGVPPGLLNRPVYIDHLAGVTALYIDASISHHIGMAPGLESCGERESGIWSYDGPHRLSVVAYIANE